MSKRGYLSIITFSGTINNNLTQYIVIFDKLCKNTFLRTPIRVLQLQLYLPFPPNRSSPPPPQPVLQD